MDAICPATSRGSSPAIDGSLERGGGLLALHRRYKDAPAMLQRTRAGRDLSRFRYHIAESFFRGLDVGHQESRILFYQSGIVTQLALSSHLLDVGFEDAWCARHLALDVSKALAYANATGLRHDSPEMARLASVLSPYWKWNRPARRDAHAPDDVGFSAEEIRELLRNLLEQVYQVTGHNRPKRWRPHIAERGAPA